MKCSVQTLVEVVRIDDSKGSRVFSMESHSVSQILEYSDCFAPERRLFTSAIRKTVSHVLLYPLALPEFPP